MNSFFLRRVNFYPGSNPDGRLISFNYSLLTDNDNCFETNLNPGFAYTWYSDYCYTRMDEFEAFAPAQHILPSAYDSFGFGFLGGQTFNVADSLIQGIVCDTTDVIYYGGKGLTRVTNTGWQLYLGDFPPNIQCQGDLTIYNNKLYMVAEGNVLVEVDKDNPDQSSIVWTFPPDILPITGLTTIKPTCHDRVTYAVGTQDSTSIFYIMDIDNQTFTEICEYEDFHRLYMN